MLNVRDFVDIETTRRRNRAALLSDFEEEDFEDEDEDSSDQGEDQSGTASDVDEEGNLIGLINDDPESSTSSQTSDEEDFEYEQQRRKTLRKQRKRKNKKREQRDSNKNRHILRTTVKNTEDPTERMTTNDLGHTDPNHSQVIGSRILKRREFKPPTKDNISPAKQVRHFLLKHITHQSFLDLSS